MLVRDNWAWADQISWRDNFERLIIFAFKQYDVYRKGLILEQEQIQPTNSCDVNTVISDGLITDSMVEKCNDTFL